MTGAKLENIMKCARDLKIKSKHYIILIAGVNDVYNGCVNNVYNNLELPLKHCRIILGGIPFIQDLPLFDDINEDIMKLNFVNTSINYQGQNVIFLDFMAMSYKCFTLTEIHLNKIGKIN